MAITMADVRAVLEPTEPDYVAAAGLGEEILPYLENLLHDGDPLAPRAIFLAALIQGERSAGILREAAQSDDPMLRGAAAGAAPYLPCEEVSEVLLPLVSDLDISVQITALESVRENATRDLRASIERLAAEESDSTVRHYARRTLARTWFGHDGVDDGGPAELAPSPITSTGSGGSMGSPYLGHGEMGDSPSAEGMALGNVVTEADSRAAAAWERAALAWENAAQAWEEQ